jgi:hypothetical protein
MRPGLIFFVSEQKTLFLKELVPVSPLFSKDGLKSTLGETLENADLAGLAGLIFPRVCACKFRMASFLAPPPWGIFSSRERTALFLQSPPHGLTLTVFGSLPRPCVAKIERWQAGNRSFGGSFPSRKHNRYATRWLAKSLTHLSTVAYARANTVS